MGKLSSRKMLSPQCLSKAKTCAKYLSALICGICSLWLVWDLCLKFFRGSTTIVREQQPEDYLRLPKFLLCMKERYKTGELASMGLPENFFSNPYPDKSKFNPNDHFPDINATWQRATWPIKELEVDWSRYDGN